MKILIVEDDFSLALDIEMYLKNSGYEDAIILDSGKKLIEFVEKETVDLLIIDVNLNDDLSGIDLAHQLDFRKIPIIFITALNDEHTFEEAMLANPSGFLIKPFDKVTLQSCVDRVLKQQQKLQEKEINSQIMGDCFFVKQNDILKKIEFDDIQWIEADGNYIKIHADDRRYATKMSLTKVEEKIAVAHFVRVHKKFLVNLKKIEAISSPSEMLVNGQAIPIGSKYRSDLLKVISTVDY